MEALAITIFVATYILLLVLPRFRAHVAVLAALLFIALGIMPLGLVGSAVDWNVILMIAGTMGIVALFIESRMPARLADLIVEKTPTLCWAVVALSLFSSLISAFVDNVATVLIVAPVAISMAKNQGISPVPSVIAVAIASNLQGAATLVGDATSIMLGGHAGMDFLDFFFTRGRLGIFWIVQAGAVAATAILYWVLRSMKGEVKAQGRTDVKDYFPSYLLISMVVLLILVSFVPTKPAITNGLICVVLAIIGLVRKLIQTKRLDVISSAAKEVDYDTILLLTGLFVIIGGITEAGLVDDISKIFVNISNGNVFLIYTLIVWASVLFSAFIDNIPYVATMLPVTQQISAGLGIEPYLLFFGLLIGATLGGNITPIGASANISGQGILRKEGYEVSAPTFMKISVPFTLSAVVTGYILIWLIWS